MIRKLVKNKNIIELWQKIAFPSSQLYDPKKYDELFKHHWNYYDPSHKSSEWTHKSNAEQLIHKIPIIEVQSSIVRCIGGTEINTGHPQIYIKLDTRIQGTVQSCSYCGLRYKMKQKH